MKKLEDLCIKHDYYCSELNYFSNDAGKRFVSWKEFYDEFKDADIDMNLCFRWDLEKRDKSEHYRLEIFIMGQRKGLFMPFQIEYVQESDFEEIKNYLKNHYDKLQKNWQPFSMNV